MKKHQRQELQPKQWFKIILNDKTIAEGAIKPIREAFEHVMPDSDASKGCALFVREDADATVVFISPGFAAIAPQLLKTLSAVESEAPPMRREADKVRTSILLASNLGGWSLLE